MKPENIFAASIISILWWVALWFLFEEAIAFTSGNKRHVKVLICMILVILIIIYTHMFPTHIKSL